MAAGRLRDRLAERTPAAAARRVRSRPAVLVTDGGNGQNRSALAAVRALAAGGYRPVVTVSGSGSLAAASRHCAGVVRVPKVESAQYSVAVRDEVDRSEYLDVMAASDAALVALDLPGADLVDKSRLGRRAAAVGLPLPRERIWPSWDALLAAARELDYPVVVKPALRTCSGQPPVRRVTSRGHLLRLEQVRGPVVVQAWVSGPMTAVCGLVRDGRLVCVAHQRYLRTWPVDAGVACALETVPGDVDREERLVALLHGYDGLFQAQFLGPHLVDLNPRVYGSLPLAVAAGVNLPARHCDLVLGRAVPFARARPGATYRWVEGDVRHLGRAWQRGDLDLWRCARALRPRRATAHSTESLRDPGPLLARLRFVLSRGA